VTGVLCDAAFYPVTLDTRFSAEMKVKTLADSVHGALNCANMHQRKPNRQSLRSR